MHKSRWKTAFFLLLAVDFALLGALFFATKKASEPLPEKREIRTETGVGAYEIALTGSALESFVNRGLRASGSEVDFRIEDDFYVTAPVSAYGIESVLNLRLKPYAPGDGYIHMVIVSFDVGNLNLPVELSLALVSTAIDRKGLYVDGQKEEIILDPDAFLPQNFGTVKATRLDTRQDRYYFEGQLGES